MKIEGTGPTSNNENTACNEGRPLTLPGRKRFYCIDCSKFTEDEVVSYDSNEHPVVSHNNGHKHNGIFATDIERLLELGTSLCGQVMKQLKCTVYLLRN
jgi:hypothetical protein